MRRNDVNQMIPAENRILDAQYAVEDLPGDERLTEAGILLGKARDLVADWVEATGNVRPD